MATQTTNYGLKKPAYSDTADIGVINSNMDIIDAKMKEIDDKAGSGGGTSGTVDSKLSTTSENPVQNKVITQELNKKGTYSKPTGGIPKTDLASDVQTSLGKADTALQEHQDISGKADKTEVTALYNSISDAWDSAIAYTVGQYCIHNNALWKCLVANTNTEPTEGTHWTKVSVANEITSLNSSLANKTTWKLLGTIESNETLNLPTNYNELLVVGIVAGNNKYNSIIVLKDTTSHYFSIYQDANYYGNGKITVSNSVLTFIRDNLKGWNSFKVQIYYR